MQTQSNIRKKIISTINHLKKNTSGSSSQTGNHSYSDAKPQTTHINTTRWLISLHLVNFLKIFLLLLRKPPFFFGFSSSAGLDVPGLEPSDLISEKLTFKGCLFELDSVLGGCLSPILETCDWKRTNFNIRKTGLTLIKIMFARKIWKFAFYSELSTRNNF